MPLLSLPTEFGTMTLISRITNPAPKANAKTHPSEALTHLILPEEPIPPQIKEAAQPTPLLEEAANQLKAYLAGKLTEFQIPLDIQGTDWQLKVWTALQTIPYGTTQSYKQIAGLAGNPKAYRAVGLANNRNPLAIIIPCHRVIGANGKLVGYGGGLKLKQQLLEMESQILANLLLH